MGTSFVTTQERGNKEYITILMCMHDKLSVTS